MKRILYLGYYFKELNWKQFKKFKSLVKQQTGKSELQIWFEMINSSLKYNISLLEYFQFHFYKISESQKKEFAGTGYMYEYQLKMNPKESRNVLEDKIIFLKNYGVFVKHDFASLTEIENGKADIEHLLKNNSGKIVLKNSKGQCGNGIEVCNVNDLTRDSLQQQLIKAGNDYVEEFVVQHADLMQLSPSGLNTIRIITQLDNTNKIHILGARLRITVKSAVDNLAAGNMAATIDITNGVVDSPGVYSDITKADAYVHPITGVSIIGFQIPYWKETMAMVKAAALIDTRNKSIGWDVAITDNGPELIEGNQDWCKLLWQLPAKKGLKYELEKFI